MKRTVAVFLGAALVGAGALQAQVSVSGAKMSFSSGSETVPGFIVAPNDAIRKPAVVVIQEWWGLNDFIREKVDFFARQGYVALAPDLYRGQTTADPDAAHQLMRGLPEDRAMRDLKGAVAYLQARADVDPKRIGVVGWCMGGGYSLSLALAEPALAGAVIYYGRLVTDDAAIKGLQVPLLGNFAGEDKGIPVESVQEFERKAKAAGKKVDFKVYPGAGHGFASSKDPQTFRAEDAKDADARTNAFFENVFKAAAKPAPKKKESAPKKSG